MRVSYLLAQPWAVINPSLYAYVALEIGRTAVDAPDAFSFLASTEFHGRGSVSNFER